MSKARKTLYATIGAGELAVERTRKLSSRLVEVPTQWVKDNSIRDLPKVAASLRTEGVKRTTTIVRGGSEKTRKFFEQAQSLSNGQFEDFAKRGEKLVGSIRKSQPTKQAVSQTKTAKAKVKAASTSVTKAAKATTDAVVTAVTKIEQSTEATA